MKIYLFCPITGVYQGEDFTDPAHMLDRREELPPGATTIAPPQYQRGEVPIFLMEETRWEVRHLVRLEDWQVTGKDGTRENGENGSPASLG